MWSEILYVTNGEENTSHTLPTGYKMAKFTLTKKPGVYVTSQTLSSFILQSQNLHLVSSSNAQISYTRLVLIHYYFGRINFFFRG